MSTSSETPVSPQVGVQASVVPGAVRLTTPELRTGRWTRFGGSSILGDEVTEAVLDDIAETARSAARAQGYSVGWAEGRREAAEQARAEEQATLARRAAEDAARAEEHAAALAALREAAERLHQAFGATCDQVEASAVELAWDLTQELVGRELSCADGAEVVRRALALMPDQAHTRLRLHPDDARVDQTLLEELETHGVILLTDASLPRGDALLEADDHVVDLSISTALSRVREVLR